MDDLLNGLKAAGEPTRLRLLALLSRGELTVSELTRIVGQSQPRVSRHLKLLCEAGLLDRYQEGTWAFYRVAEAGPGADLARTLVAMLPADDAQLGLDLERLAQVKRHHAETANAYFRDVAASWDRIRSLYVDDAELEAAMIQAAGPGPIGTLVDLGTGTGRILQVFSGRVDKAIGVDFSHEMLSVARANLAGMGLGHCQVRKGDIYHLGVSAAAADLVTIHNVLHFLDDPGAAVVEAARILRPGGRLVVVDFAPHGLELLRSDYAHRRLGFDDEEVAGWCTGAGLADVSVRHLTPAGGAAEDRLTVSLWTCIQAAVAQTNHLEVA